MTPQTIRISDFCRLYGLGRTKTYELINEGVLKRVKVGGRSLITWESAQALIKPQPGTENAAPQG
jgi:excisionase family DNA binding protein